MSHSLIIATAFATALTGVAYAQQPKPATDVTQRWVFSKRSKQRGFHELW